MFIVSTGDDMLQSAEEYVQKLFLSPFWKMENYVNWLQCHHGLYFLTQKVKRIQSIPFDVNWIQIRFSIKTENPSPGRIFVYMYSSG